VFRVLRLTRVLGNVAEPLLAEQLHGLEHRGLVETITLEPQDTARRRLRAITDRGTDSAIILNRAQRLSNGAVLLLEAERAVIVRLTESTWLGVRACDAATALELGYLAGNMHWKVRFEADALWVRLEGAEAQYRARLAELVDAGRATVIAAPKVST